MKIVVISLPKSGTYLMGNVLQNLGYENTYKHLSKSGGQEYDPNNIEEGIRNPRKYDSSKSLKKNLSEIKDGQYALSHLGYDQETEELLKDFFIIYLERDTIEIEDSFRRWCEKSGRPHKPWRTEKLDSIRNWRDKADIVLDFHDMVDLNIAKIDELQKLFFGCVNYDSIQVLEKSIAMDSMTKV